MEYRFLLLRLFLSVFLPIAGAVLIGVFVNWWAVAGLFLWFWGNNVMVKLDKP